MSKSLSRLFTSRLAAFTRLFIPLASAKGSIDLSLFLVRCEQRKSDDRAEALPSLLFDLANCWLRPQFNRQGFMAHEFCLLPGVLTAILLGSLAGPKGNEAVALYFVALLGSEVEERIAPF